MKRATFFTGCIALLLMLSSCIIIGVDDSSFFNNFNNSLRGTWETLPSLGNTASLQLEIDYNTITITGTGMLWSQQPLYGYTRNFPLSGYSEETQNSFWYKEGSIYLRNAGTWETIPYVYESSGSQEILTLKGSSLINNLTFHKQN